MRWGSRSRYALKTTRIQVKKIFSLASALGVGVAEFMGMVEDRLKAVDLPPVIRSGAGES